MGTITYRAAITKVMDQIMSDIDKSVIFGIGVPDRIGVFGTTKGLAEKYGENRVFDTPIAEESMTGMALGMSLAGLYPIHIHIRADFLMVAMNQIVNHIAKYKYMYGGLYEVPLLIRAVVGRSWGQGAQHSQSPQALFSHVPGLTVVMPSNAKSLMETYYYSAKHYKSPVLSIEHRLLYEYEFNEDSDLKKVIDNPFRSYKKRDGKDVTIVASSIAVQDALRASKYLEKEYCIQPEVIDLHCLSHIDEELIMASVNKTGRLLVVDTGWESYGACAEVSRIILKHNPKVLSAPLKTLSMAKSPCPTSKPLENHFYPSPVDIIKDVIGLVKQSDISLEKIPTLDEMNQEIKAFKGPF